MISYIITNDFEKPVEESNVEFEKEFQLPSKYMKSPIFSNLRDSISFLEDLLDSHKKHYTIIRVESGEEEKICIGDGIHFFSGDYE